MANTYFTDIHSLADLKKQYRRLALQNHPDRGGDTETMKSINAEFERLYEVWKDAHSTTSTSTGYEYDGCGQTAREYTQHVWNEYCWKGRNYTGQFYTDVAKLMRTWLKQTYPKYKFSVRCRGYKSVAISLMSADFAPFTKASGKVYGHWYGSGVLDDDTLTDRARDVMSNVYDRVMSYNFDDSNPIIDYFNVNFYLDLEIGRSDKLYKVELPKVKGRACPAFKPKEGPAHKAIRQALGKLHFAVERSGYYAGKMMLGQDSYYMSKLHFDRMSYGSQTQAQKRMDKLAQAGILCKMVGMWPYYIEFLGYKPEVEAMLERERRDEEQARKEWEAKHKDCA